MKQKRFNLEEVYIPTKQEIEKNKIIHNKCLFYGIPVGIFTDTQLYTKEEIKGLKYITSNKPLPKKLEDTLLSTKEERLKTHESITTPSKDIQITPKDVEEIFHIKL